MYPGDETYVYSIRPNNLEGTVVAPNNYWGSDNPDFSALIDKSRAPNGSVDYFPYYSDVALGTLIYKMVTISEDTVWATPHPNQKVTVLDGATLTLSVPMSLDTVTMREGAQIKSNLADQTGSVTTKSLRFSPDLSGTEWKALGMPLASAVIKNSTEEEISAPSTQNVDNGIWFARLKDNKTPEFVVDESTFGMAGLWAANGDTYTISSEGAFEFKTLEEPAAPTETACRKLINATSEIEGMKDLWTKLDAIKNVDTSNMPSAVQNSVRSAISNAENVTTNDSSTMDALKDAKSQLEQASNDIQSYQDLVAKIEEAQQVYEGLADDAAHKDDLNQAIQNAQTALNDPNATTGDFNHANDALDLNIKLAQAKFRNAYENIEAEEFTKFETDAHDSRIVNDGNNIGGVASGTWVKYSNVYFSGNGAKKVTFFYAAQQRDAGGGQIHIRLGSLDGKEIATLTCPATGSNWSNYVELSGELTEITKGMHDVYLYFENNTGKTYVANVDWFRFTEASSSHVHSWSNEWSKDETHHWHACSGCDEKNDVEPHTPGSAATENDPQTCTVCGYIIAPATGHIHHTTTLVPAVEATCVDKGHRAYYTCSGCSKLFADENATEELTEADITPKTDPTNHVGGTEVLNAKDATYTEEGYTGDTCCKSCHAVISYGHVIPKLTKPSKPSGGTVRPVSPNAGVGKKPEAEKEALPFTDVPQTAWYYESVQSAWAAGLIDGVTATKFKPDDTLTVAQAIKLAAALYQMEHEGEVTLRNGGANWYDSYVNYAVTNGIIEKDYANYTKAQMNAPVTRGEFVHIFHGAEDAYKAINTVADNAIPDVKATDKFAAEIYEFYRAGILTGSDAKGTFHPASSIKRSEVATILLRMFETSARVSIDLP